MFNYWTGRGAEKAPGFRLALESIRRAVERGVQVTLLHGNRDFLLDEELKQRWGIDLVRRSHPLALGSSRVLICHGDLLLLRDRANLRFRWILRSAWVRALHDVLPSAWVERIAARLRRTTSLITARKDRELFEVPAEAVARLLRGGYDVLICGHVHEQACRSLRVDGEKKVFYTLGAWDREASVLEYDQGDFKFKNFPLVADP